MRATTLLGSTLLMAVTPLVHADTMTTFDDGDTMGWTGPAGSGGATVIEPTGGNPTWNMRTIFNDFGITFWNNTNTDFIQDLTQFESVTFSIDIKVNSIVFWGTPVSRPFLVDLRDYDAGQGGYPWSSVWFKFDDIDAVEYGEWTTLSVTIDNPQSTEMLPGWGATGPEDPETHEPR